jgi:plasmid stabilization system protein ParE
MAFQYYVNEQADEEYGQAYEWYELKELGLGEKFMHAVEERLKQIIQSPEYYTILHGNYRQTKIDGFPYTIVYQFYPKKKAIHIASIHHTKRNPRRRFRKNRKQ